jgi:serine/threonine protein phosphatase PrpC
MDVRRAAFSRPGSRETNQDSSGEAALPAGRCFIVADGAGGHRGGAVASRLVVDTIVGALREEAAFDADALRAAIEAASAKVCEQQKADPAFSNMSSTVVVLCIDAAGENAWWGHLGDSRIYHFRRGIIESISKDHSVVQSLIDAGVYKSGDVRGHLDRSLLFAAIGSEGDTSPTVTGPVALQDGDAFLLCSDGVWEGLQDARVETLLRRSGSVDEWNAAIEHAVVAADKPNQDNYSAIAIWVGSPEAITVFGA